MNVRELAETDLQYTLENKNASGTPYILISPDGTEYTVTGTVGDIALLYEPVAGEITRNRSIICTCRILTLSEQTELVPERGWKAIVKYLHGKAVNLFVRGNDPDRMLGTYRMVMELNMDSYNE